MKDLLSIIAVILIIGWLIGWVGFGQALGAFIHLLLIFAFMAILIRLIGWGLKGK